jgi:ribulose-5-phosphate 4-epimerase/fuculose-1-phosphate aldolase
MERTLLEQHRSTAEQVVTTARDMVARGLAYGVAGNVSARLPDGRGLLITPSGKNYA